MWTKGGSVPGADGSPVGNWQNDDINGKPLQQPISTSQPLLKTNATDNINFNPTVAHNPATNKYMFASTGFAGSTSHNSVYAYIVTKPNNITQNSVLLREGPSGAGNKLVMVQSTGSVMKWAGGEDSATLIQTASGAIEAKPTIWTFSKNTAATPSGFKTDIRKNGVVVASSNTATSFTGSNQNFYINAFKFNTNTFLGSYDGNVAEVIYVLDSNLTALQQNKIESYLALKYGNTLGNTGSPVSYTASNGTTVFWAADATYQNDVFGIGTDSASGLVQAKSNSLNTGSGDGTGQSGKGNLVLSTNTTLGDLKFLMLGSDNATLAQSVIASGQAATVAVGSTRIGREWKIDNTGGVGAVDLSFDTTGLGLQAGGAVVSNYALMIDNDGNGNFNDGTLTFFTATSASGKKIIFSGVTLPDNAVMTIITLKSSVLPAIWLGFTADAVDGNALLKWKTSDEINVDHYTVEHSFNGVSFSPVGTVAANNNSGVNQYSFTHTGLTAGAHYYRIRRTDKDGKSEYSDIKTVKITATGANVQVRPNPVVGTTLTLAVSVQQSSKTAVQVMSVEGKIILQQNINLNAGNNLVNLNISNVPSGIYLVQVKLADEVVTRKFIRQN